MAVEHPSLFSIAFLRAAPHVELGPEVSDAARSGYELLTERIQRLADAGLLGGRDVQEATRQFNALCFGMAVTELLNASQLGPDPEGAWRSAFETLLSGFRAPAARLSR
jgi:AcrR family transcriptional regulator